MPTEAEIACLAHSCKVRVVEEFRGTRTECHAVVNAQKMPDHQWDITAATKHTCPMVTVQDPCLLGRFDPTTNGDGRTRSFARLGLRGVVQLASAFGASHDVLAVCRNEESGGDAAIGAGLPRQVFASLWQCRPEAGDPPLRLVALHLVPFAVRKPLVRDRFEESVLLTVHRSSMPSSGGTRPSPPEWHSGGLVQRNEGIWWAQASAPSSVSSTPGGASLAGASSASIRYSARRVSVSTADAWASCCSLPAWMTCFMAPTT